MHAQTIAALISFHERFVSTHHVHFGNLLVSRMQSGRDAALRQMAVILAGAAPASMSAADPPEVPEPEPSA
jgi:hypothetical protein